MFINPLTAIKEGWIQNVKNPTKQVQPNAIDFELSKVMSLDPSTIAYVSETEKVMRKISALEPGTGWMLEAGKVYDGMSEIYVELPSGVAAILYTRSTFARNGVFIMSGMYDSGYKGTIGYTIYTLGGPIGIAVGTRIGQIAFVQSDSAGVYAGGWNHAPGTHYTEKAVDQQERSVAQQLEDSHRMSSDQESKPAGTKSFL